MSYMKTLNKIRAPHKGSSLSKKIIFSLLCALFGIALGVYSGFIDSNINLPEIFYILDVLFGRIAFLSFIALVIYVFSKTPIRAAINAFCISAGILVGYFIYSYSYFVAGNLPDSELTMYGILVVISPIIAVLCWYAKGYGTVATILSALIISFFILQAFSFATDFSYFEIKPGLEIILLPISIAVLYKKPKQTIFSVLLAILLAYFIVLLPFSIPFI